MLVPYADERLDVVNERITLLQKKDGLTFGTDAYLLAAYLRTEKYGRAVELGCGTGIISLLAASRKKFHKIYALEIQETFADLARRNAEGNGLSDIVQVLCKDIRDMGAVDVDGEVDAVFANPPYMRTDSGKANRSDAKYIARHEVCGDIGDFCRCAAKLLKHGGRFYCVYRPDRLSELMAALRQNRLEPKTMRFVHADEKSEPSMLLLCATKGAAPFMRIAPPLLLHSANTAKERARELTEEAQRVYDTMNLE